MLHLCDGPRRSGRREFLSWCSAAAASGLLWGEAGEAAYSQPPLLPTIALGRYRVSRLIVGMYPRRFDQPGANAQYTRRLGVPG